MGVRAWWGCEMRECKSLSIEGAIEAIYKMKKRRKAKIEICWEQDPFALAERPIYWWNLRGDNGRVICRSYIYHTKASAMRSAKRAKQAMLTAEVVDDR